MATITAQGGALKVYHDAQNINYYPIDDVTHEVLINVIQLFLNGNLVESFKLADITAPAGATLEEKADNIALLLAYSGNILDVSIPIEQTQAAGLVRSTNDHVIDVNRGLLTGFSYDHIVGRDPAIGSSYGVITPDSAATYNFLQTASPLRIKSGGNAQDDATGTGARKVKIVGLDANWDKITEDVVTAGTSASAATSQSFIRVNRVFVTEVGTYGAINTGDIVIETTGGDELGTIAADYGKTVNSVWSIPNGFTGYLTRIAVTVAKNKLVDFKLHIRNGGNDTSVPFGAGRVLVSYDEIEESYEEKLSSFRKISSYSDVWAEAQVSSGGGSSIVNVTYDIITVPN